MEPQMIDFAKLVFDDRTTDQLFGFCKKHRLGLAAVDGHVLSAVDFKFHVTVIYSRKNSPAFQEGTFSINPVVMRPESFDLFGPNADILALRLHSDRVLTDLFDHYRNTYGHVSDFMPYRPHVSIRGNDGAGSDRIEHLPLPDFELRADRIIHQLKAA